MEQVKKLNSIPEVSTLNSTDRILLTDANGKSEKISPSNLKSQLVGSIDMYSICSNIFVVFYEEYDWSGYRFPLAIPLSSWKSYQDSGKAPQGILVVDGDKKLVVALTESTNKLKWASANLAGGAFTTGDRLAAMNDYAGKTNTKAIVTSSNLSGDGVDYAPRFCYNYSSPNLNGHGQGLKAGQWWLPSLGELYTIFANFEKINFALSLCTGAQLLVRDAYWSSTEYSATNAWYLGFNDGFQGLSAKSTYQYRVRPVSAFY